MPNTITWSNLEHIFTATGPVYFKGIVQTYFRESPFLALIQQKGNIEKVSVSGPTVVQRLRYGGNTTVGWRSTRGEVPIEEQSMLTTAAWNWGSLTGAVTFYDEDLHDNMGEAQLVDLVQVTLDQLADTIKNKIASAILQGTSGDPDPSANEQVSARILGLKDAVTTGGGTSTNPANIARPATYGGLTDVDLGGQIAGLNQGAWSAAIVAGTSQAADIPKNLRALVNRCTWGTVKPDFLLAPLEIYEAYESSMVNNIRYVTLNVGDTSFEGLAVRGIPLIFDRLMTGITSVPTGWSGSATESSTTHRVYAIRAADWKWVFDPQWDMQNGLEPNWRIPEDGFRRTRLLCIRSQLICVNRTTQGLLYGQGLA